MPNNFFVNHVGSLGGTTLSIQCVTAEPTEAEVKSMAESLTSSDYVQNNAGSDAVVDSLAYTGQVVFITYP